MTSGMPTKAIDTICFLMQEMFEVADRPLVVAVILKFPALPHIAAPFATEIDGSDGVHVIELIAAD